MSQSSFTVECWGCRKSETHSPIVGPEADAALADMEARGWRRRAFWPDSWDKGPWFCSGECAHESYNAKRAEEWWANKDEEDRQRQFQKYCRDTIIPKGYYIALFIVAVAWATLTIKVFQ